MFHIKIVESKEIWEKFLADVSPHTFLQSWNWGEFNRATGSKIFPLGIFKNGDLVGICLTIRVKARRGIHLLCPHGPILTDWTDTQCFEVLIEYLKKIAEAQRASFIRICPSISASLENKKLFQDYNFRRSPIHTHPELAWILDISHSESEILSAMRKQTRYSIKKAEKDSVKVEKSEEIKDLKKFYEVYSKTARGKNFTPFSFDFLEKEFSTFSSDRQALLFFASYREEIIAVAMIIFSYRSAFYHHGASLPLSGITAPHLLQWEIIKEAKQRGKEMYNFWGVAPEGARKKHPWSGFSFFKRSFGGFEESYISSQDLVLNRKYWLNFIIEHFRKMRRGF